MNCCNQFSFLIHRLRKKLFSIVVDRLWWQTWTLSYLEERLQLLLDYLEEVIIYVFIYKCVILAGTLPHLHVFISLLCTVFDSLVAVQIVVINRLMWSVVILWYNFIRKEYYSYVIRTFLWDRQWRDYYRWCEYKRL